LAIRSGGGQSEVARLAFVFSLPSPLNPEVIGVGAKMGCLRRSTLAIVTATALGIATPAHAEKTLRAVMHSDLKILDPIWTTAYIVRNHGYMIYDTLFATDEKGDESKLALASLRPVVELI
jgi:hypothetical protein